MTPQGAGVTRESSARRPIRPPASGTVPNALIVNPDVPAKSVSELVALAKRTPGKLNYASPGVGTSLHLAGELFKLDTGTALVHVA